MLIRSFFPQNASELFWLVLYYYGLMTGIHED